MVRAFSFFSEADAGNQRTIALNPFDLIDARLSSSPNSLCGESLSAPRSQHRLCDKDDREREQKNTRPLILLTLSGASSARH